MSNIKKRMCRRSIRVKSVLLLIILTLTGCATFKGEEPYRDQNMDFGAVRTVAVLPFTNLTRESAAGERVRDVFITSLLATGGVYVVPAGEVARGMVRAGISTPTDPSTDEIVKLGGLIKADAVITGVIREYGEVRSGSAMANTISLSLRMLETQTGRVVWSASDTKGGIGVTDRLFGGGGEPMNKITEKAVNDLINKLFP